MRKSELFPRGEVHTMRLASRALADNFLGGPAEELFRAPGPSEDSVFGIQLQSAQRGVVEVLQRHGVELVVMAGFGTILEKPVHDAYAGRILNTHPSLLPAFAGWHAVEEAMAAGVKVTGCTVHLATLECAQYGASASNSW